MGFQIIPQADPKISAGRRFSDAIGAGLETGGQMMQQYQQKELQKQQMQQENQAAKRMGVDLSGISDPKTRQEIVSLALQGQNQLALEGKKQGAPQKPLTLLQQSQKNLADERLKALQSNQSLFKSLTGQQSTEMQQQGQENPQMEGQEQGQSQQGVFDISKVPEDKLRQIAAFKGQPGQEGILGNIAQSELDKREDIKKQDRQIQLNKDKLGLSRDNDILKQTDSFRNMLPSEDASLEMMRDSLINGDQSFFSGNNLAEKTGLEWFRDAAGGQFKTGSKTFLINNVSKFGARPNQYIEQQMADALAKVGRSRAANMVTYQALTFDSDIKKEFLKQSDEKSESNYKPGSLGKVIQKGMTDFVTKRQSELAEKIKFIKSHEKQIDETPKGKIPMIDDKGRLVYIPIEQIDEAKFHGAIDL